MRFPRRGRCATIGTSRCCTHMMKTVYISLIAMLVGLTTQSFAQVYSQRLEEAISQGDTALQRKILHEWRFEWPEDADRMLAQSAFLQRKYAMERDSALRQAYLAASTAELEAAKRTFPERLDVRFAYITLLGDQGEYEAYTAEILDLLAAHDDLGEAWRWRNGNRLRDVDNFVQQYVAMYTLQLYNTKDESLHPLMDTISNRLLTSDPYHVPGLLSLSINAQRRQDYAAAITYLERAKEAQPDNTSVLDNLGTAYEKIGNMEAAIACYEQIKLVGNDSEINYAVERLKELGQP